MKRKNDSNNYYTEKALCAMIGAAVTGRKAPSADDRFDLQAALSFARSHNILPIAYYALEHAGISGGLMSDAEKTSGNLVFKQMKLNVMENALSNAFSKHEIPHFILKGSQIQKYFPKGMVRISTDIDFYIDEQYIERVKPIMRSFGLESTSYNALSKTYCFEKQPRYSIEIHCMLDQTIKPAEQDFLASLLQNSVHDEGCRMRLCNESLYLHTFFHLYKHFSGEGAGVKMFLDIFVLSRSLPLKTESIENRLKEIHLDKFHSSVLKECERLFDKPELEEKADYMTEKILNDGAFGKPGLDSSGTKIIMSEDPAASRKLTLARITGTGRDTMIKKYPVLKKAPFLLPACHVHRAVKGVITKPKKAVTVIKEAKIVSSRRIKKQKSEMEKIGLRSDK